MEEKDLIDRLMRVENAVTLIKDNHLAHISADLIQVKTDMDWVKKFFWIVATAAIGGFITGAVTLVLNITK